MKYPDLVVFDLDDCVWSPETYTLDVLPSKDHVLLGDLAGKGDGVVGVQCGHQTMSLHPGALYAFQQHQENVYGKTRFAVASSADTPFATRCAHAALKLLEVVPGVTVATVLEKNWSEEVIAKNSHLQIGRSPPLSSDKSRTHFPILKRVSGVDYSGMLFFDDSNWSDHCEIVARVCKGTVTQRTPHGMQIEEWNKGLKKYQNKYGKA